MAAKGLELRIAAIEKRLVKVERRPDPSAQILQLRTEMAAGFSALSATLSKQILDGDEETRRLARELNADTCTQMRVLHEEVIRRISLLGEAPTPRPRKAGKPRAT